MAIKIISTITCDGCGYGYKWTGETCVMGKVAMLKTVKQVHSWTTKMGRLLCPLCQGREDTAANTVKGGQSADE